DHAAPDRSPLASEDRPVVGTHGDETPHTGVTDRGPADHVGPDRTSNDGAAGDRAPSHHAPSDHAASDRPPGDRAPGDRAAAAPVGTDRGGPPGPERTSDATSRVPADRT